MYLILPCSWTWKSNYSYYFFRCKPDTFDPGWRWIQGKAWEGDFSQEGPWNGILIIILDGFLIEKSVWYCEFLSWSFGFHAIQEATYLKQKLEKCESDLENTRKSSELSFTPLVAADPCDLAGSPMKEMYYFWNFILLV